MYLKIERKPIALTFLLTCIVALTLPGAWAASCKTESQMTAAERDALSQAARAVATQVQGGDSQGLKANTLPAVASDFNGIAAAVDQLKPLVQGATLTIYDLYELDASTEAAGAPNTSFYCGTPVVVLNFQDLPPGFYALAIMHATGVPKPQQLSFILSKTPDNKWLFAGIFPKPMTEDGHDGLWYWTSARKFAQKNGNWSAWFYYRTAANLLNPVSFLSSSNLDKLQREEDKVKPTNLPGPDPITVNAGSSVYKVTAVDITTELGPLDLDVHYTPDATQAAQLRDPPAARKQIMEVMSSLIALHPDLHEAFHGMWVHADQGNASIFSLELSMDQVSPAPPTAMNAKPASN